MAASQSRKCHWKHTNVKSNSGIDLLPSRNSKICTRLQPPRTTFAFAAKRTGRSSTTSDLHRHTTTIAHDQHTSIASAAAEMATVKITIKNETHAFALETSPSESIAGVKVSRSIGCKWRPACSRARYDGADNSLVCLTGRVPRQRQERGAPELHPAAAQGQGAAGRQVARGARHHGRRRARAH